MNKQKRSKKSTKKAATKKAAAPRSTRRAAPATAKASTTFPRVRQKVAAALGLGTPAPKPSGRDAVDWVAAGRKAYETRLKNAALKAKAAGTSVPGPEGDVLRARAKAAKGAKAAPVKVDKPARAPRAAKLKTGRLAFEDTTPAAAAAATV